LKTTDSQPSSKDRLENTLNTGNYSEMAQTSEESQFNQGNPLRLSMESRLLMGLLFFTVIYSLWIAKQLLIPIMLAFILSLLLAPLVRYQGKLNIPRPLGAALVVVTILTVFSLVVSSTIEPVSNWIEQSPRVLKQLEMKVYPIKKKVEEVTETAAQMDRLTSVDSQPSVKVKEISLRDLLYSNAQTLITSTIMVAFLVYFMLSWGKILILKVARIFPRNEFRHQFIRLSLVLEKGVSRYLATITLINLCLGIVVAIILYAFGVPNSHLWGVVAGLFNFIPYIGPMLVCLFLGATVLLIFDGFLMATIIVSSFIAITVIEGQIVTPLILGKQLALNPLIVFLSVVFWFWLWGVLGAFMAVPLLIMIKFMGEQIKPLNSISSIVGR